MRKVILDLAVSLDGLIEGPHGEYDWCIMDEEVKFDAFLNQVDIIFFGRKSYELWGNYTPGPQAPAWEKELLDLTNSKEKYVFSRTLKSIPAGVKIISDNIEEEVQKLKQQSGRDIWLYGGASLVTSFIRLGLIDEYRLAVHPIILGQGKPLFKDIPGRVKLKLTGTKVHSSGVILLTYKA